MGSEAGGGAMGSSGLGVAGNLEHCGISAQDGLGDAEGLERNSGDGMKNWQLEEAGEGGWAGILGHQEN